MSANAPRTEDYLGYYQADIGYTWQHSVPVTPALVQNTDAQGPLEPGRYLAVARSFSDPTSLMWLHVGAFEKGALLAPGTPVAQGPSRIPLSVGGYVEFNVIAEYNDRLAATMSVGTGTLHLTKISR